MPTIRGNARGEAAIRPLVLSLITIAAVVGLSALAALSPLGDDGFVYPDEADFDSDKSMDTIVLLPEGDGQEGEGGIAGNCTIGEVRIVSGTTGQTITRFVASTCDDSFGSAVSIIRDVDFDGNDDLIVGAPLNGAGRAYVFRGPFGTGTGTQVIYAHEADLEFFAPPDVERFGERVGMTTDLDGDGVPDLRIRGRATSGTGSLVRTFFVSGTDGFPLFVVAGSSPFNPWLRPQADVDDDGDVDAADLAKVVLNQGMSGPAVTIFDGDVNNDDQVNGTDVAIVQAALGISQLGPITIGTDPDVGGDWGVWICPPTPTPGYWCAPNCWDFDLHLPDNVDPLCLPLICQAWCGVDIIDHGAPLMPFETYAKPYVFEAVGLTQDAEWEILEGGERMLLLTDLVGPTLEFIPLRNGPVRVRVTNEICTYICQAEAETHLQLLDSDGDGMPNAWENQWSGVLDAYNPLDAEEDPDFDGIKNLYEFAYGTDPTTPDAPDDLDGDGIPDSCEIAVGTDPDDPTDPVNPQLDSDGDGVSDFYEICVFWTNPDEPDTDGDGIPDGWEIASGLDPLFQGDAWFDADGDGIANFLEYFVGADPNDPLSVLPVELDADQNGILDWIESLYGSNPAGSITYAPGDMAWAIINDAIVPLDSTVIELCVGDCFKLHGSGWAFSWQVLQGGDKISEQFPDTPDSCLSGKWCIDEPGTIVIAAATADGATGGQPPEGGASVFFGTITIIAKSQEECEEGCEVDVGICGGGSIPKVVCVDQEICLTASGVEGPGEYQWTALEFVEFVGPSTGQSVTVRITGPGEVTVSASKNECIGGVSFTVLDPDLDVDSDNSGGARGQPPFTQADDDAEEQSPGRLVPRNNDDLNSDGDPDHDDFGAELAAFEENSFIPLLVNKISAAAPAGHTLDWTIVYDPTTIRIWTKVAALAGEGAPQREYADGMYYVIASGEFYSRGQDYELFIEGLRAGTGSITLSVQVWNQQQQSVDFCSDLVTVTVVEADLDSDANRDGVVTSDDADDLDEHRWRYGESAAGKNGAIVLVNNDDDDGDGVPDCLNTVVDGESDLGDLTPVVFRKIPLAELPTGWKARLTVDDGADAINLFAPDAGGQHVCFFWGVPNGDGPADLELSPEMVQSMLAGDIQVLAEAIRYPGWPRQNFDGLITIGLRIADGSGAEFHRDVVQVRVAPWLMLSHVDPVTEVYVSNTHGARGPGDDGGPAPPFTTRLANALAAAGQGAVTQTIIAVGVDSGDPWAQDQFEIGYHAAPGAGAAAPPKWSHVALNSPRDRHTDYGSVLHNYVKNSLLTTTTGAYGITGLGPWSAADDTDNYFGNLELLPPFGTDWTAGHVYRGGGMLNGLDSLLNKQSVQGSSPSTVLNTGWLEVRHVDEFVCVQRLGDGSFRVLIADIQAGIDALGSWPNYAFDASQTWNRDTYTAQELVLNGGSFNQNLIAELSVVRQQLLAIGIPETQIRNVPAFFWGADSNNDRIPDPGSPAFSALPNMLNALAVNGAMIVPDPMFPPFRTSYESEVGGTIQWIDCLEYHWETGDVHCGTNSRRTPSSAAAAWWLVEP